MNTMQDVERIAGNLETVGMYVTLIEDKEGVTQQELNEAYLNAFRKAEQYEREIKALKLSKEDRKNLSLIRDVFRLTRKSLEAASKQKMMQAKVFSLQAKTKSAEYEVRVAKTLQRKSPGG